MGSALPKRREAGTYVTLDKARLTSLLGRMSTPTAILLYLETKTNYDRDGATLGELIDTLGRTPKTIQNSLSLLKSEGEVIEKGGRYYPGEGLPAVIQDAPSREPSRTSSRDLSRNSGSGGVENVVLDAIIEPLKEEKEVEGKEEGSLERESAFETVAKIIGHRNAAWLRDRRSFDFERAVVTWGEKLLEVWQKALADPPRKPRDRPIFRFQDACEGMLDLSPPTERAGFFRSSGRHVKSGTSCDLGFGGVDIVAEKHRKDREEWAKQGVFLDG